MHKSTVREAQSKVVVVLTGQRRHRLFTLTRHVVIRLNFQLASTLKIVGCCYVVMHPTTKKSETLGDGVALVWVFLIVSYPFLALQREGKRLR